MGKRPGTVLGLGDHMIELTNEDAVMFREPRLTKGDLVGYYLEVAAHMLPHLEDRPLTVERFRKGVKAGGFIQKNAPESYPGWVRREFVHRKKTQAPPVEHVVCDDVATLVFLANQRCVTLHVPPVRADMLDHPDQVIFDFDPPDEGEASFAAVREGAQQVGELLRQLGLRPYVKTSGSKGLHVIAPLDRRAHVDDVRAFGKAVCEVIARQYPGTFTTSVSKEERVGKVFLDYLRNGYAQTVVAPYSVRAIEGAPVSTPITWQELRDPEMHARRFTVTNVRPRLNAVGDPWRDIRRDPGSLDAAAAALDNLR
ncbi:MAG: ATP-dependent DNA ligase [Myxococcales bacterium]|nr:ATP-dependent DNA ligase [Myxococcales bacterium]